MAERCRINILILQKCRQAFLRKADYPFRLTFFLVFGFRVFFSQIFNIVKNLLFYPFLTAGRTNK